MNEQDLNIVHREVDPRKGVVYSHMDTARGFKEKYQNRVYKIRVPSPQTNKRKVTDEDAATKVDTYVHVCPAVMWINSPMRLQYKRKVFCPAPYENDEDCARSDELNDWTGFTHKQTRSYTTDQLGLVGWPLPFPGFSRCRVEVSAEAAWFRAAGPKSIAWDDRVIMALRPKEEHRAASQRALAEVRKTSAKNKVLVVHSL